MIIGYINSIEEMSHAEQKVMLKQEGHCNNFIIEKRTKGETNVKLAQMIESLRSGDQLMVCSIYVFSMSLLDLLKLIESLDKKGVGFISFNEKIYNGKLLAKLSRFGKYTRKQRSMFGLNSRKRGQEGGRPEGLSKEAKETAKAAVALYNNDMPIKGILTALNIKSTATLYKYLRHEGIQIGKSN